MRERDRERERKRRESTVERVCNIEKDSKENDAIF